MKEGKLEKTEIGWVVHYDEVTYTPIGNQDFKVTRKSMTLPTHPDHTLWVKMWGEDDMDVCFVISNNFACLKPCYPDTHEYIQD